MALVVILAGSPTVAAGGDDHDWRSGPDVPATAIDLRRQRSQNSPTLATDPRDSRFVVLAYRVDSPTFDCALVVSGDGGRSWIPVRPVVALPAGADRCYAPEVGFDHRGTLYYLFVGLQGPGNRPMGAYLTTSRDRGQTFTTPRRVLGGDKFMVRMAVDRRQGRIHLVWLDARSGATVGGLVPGANPLMTAHSDDRGSTFSPPMQVSDPSRERVVAPAVALDADGDLHVAYYDLQDDAVDYQGLEGPTWAGHWSVVLSSGDGSGRFSHVAIDEQVVPPERVMLIFTMAPPALVVDRPRVLVSWWDANNGDWDVFLRRSDDGGRTWEPRRRLNEDAPGNGRHQYLPRLSVAPSGRIDAIYYDRRADAQNLHNHVSYTFSRDGGRRFSPSVRLTTAPSDTRTGARYPLPSAQGKVEIGSRLALASGPSGALAAWTDTRLIMPGEFHQDVFTARVGHGSASRTTRPSWWPAAGLAAAAAAAGAGVAGRRLARRRHV